MVLCKVKNDEWNAFCFPDIYGKSRNPAIKKAIFASLARLQSVFLLLVTEAKNITTQVHRSEYVLAEVIDIVVYPENTANV